MRGRSSTWTRVRVNLEHVPEALRPDQQPLDPDYDPYANKAGSTATITAPRPTGAHERAVTSPDRVGKSPRARREE
jgi:hypothetical protein